MNKWEEIYKENIPAIKKYGFIRQYFSNHQVLELFRDKFEFLQWNFDEKFDYLNNRLLAKNHSIVLKKK